MFYLMAIKTLNGTQGTSRVQLATFFSRLLDVDLTYFPVLVLRWDVDGHVLAVLPVAVTLRHARDPVIPVVDDTAEFAR